MAEIDDYLDDRATGYQISLLRVEAGMRAKTLAALNELEADIIGTLEKNKANLSPGKKAGLEATLTALQSQVKGIYKEIGKTNETDLEGVAKVTTKKTVADLSGALGVSVGPMQLSGAQVSNIVKGPVLEGNPMEKWWSSQADKTTRLLNGEIQKGMFLGEGVDELARRIRGTKAQNYNDGVLQVTKREAEAIVRTAVQTVANTAKLETLMNSSEAVKGVRWSATLDNRTTPTCRGLDKLAWRLPDFEPIDHDKKFPGPIAHWGCRSTQVAVTRSWDELAGKRLPEINGAAYQEAFEKSLRSQGWGEDQIAKAVAKQRASMSGPVSASLDFDAWAKGKGDDFLKGLLGPGRFALYKANNLSMRDLTDQKGRELTIAQLEQAIDAGALPIETEGFKFIPLEDVEEKAAKASKGTPPLEGPTQELLDAAAAEIADIVANPTGQVTLAKTIAFLQETEPNLNSVSLLARATAIADEKKAASNKASLLSLAKKKLLAGAQPTAAQQAVIDSLGPEESANWLASIEDAKAAAAGVQFENLLAKIDATDPLTGAPTGVPAAPEWGIITPDQKAAAEKLLAQKKADWASIKANDILTHLQEKFEAGKPVEFEKGELFSLKELEADQKTKIFALQEQLQYEAKVAKLFDDVVAGNATGAKLEDLLSLKEEDNPAVVKYLDKYANWLDEESSNQMLEAFAGQGSLAAEAVKEAQLSGQLTKAKTLETAYKIADDMAKTELYELAGENGKKATATTKKIFKDLTGYDSIEFDKKFALDPKYEEGSGEALALLEKLNTIDAEKKAASNLSSKLSNAKKKLVAGKKLSPGEQAAVDSLDPAAKATWEESVQEGLAAAGKGFTQPAPVSAADQWYIDLLNGTAPNGTAAIAQANAIVDTTATATAPDLDVKNLDLFIPDPGTLTIIRTLPGSTAPTLRKDEFTGKLWVVKSPEQGGGGVDHLKTEALADELYRIVGARVPGSKFLESGGSSYKVAEFVDGAKTLGDWEKSATPAQRKDVYEQLESHFVMDALLGNWDVAGQSNDNILVTSDGKAIRVDNGGSLDYRAQGTVKNASEWKASVTELETMRDPGVAAGRTAYIFAGMTDAKINEQIVRILESRDELLDAVKKTRGAKVAKVLEERIKWLEERLPASAVKPKKPRGKKDAPVAPLLTRIATPDLAEFDAAANTSYGTPIIAGASWEDQEVMMWRERTTGGNVIYKLEGKLTKSESDRILNSFAAAGVDTSLTNYVPAAKTSANAAVASKVSKFDTFWPAIEAAAKTIVTHAGDGAYNLGTLQTYEAQKALIDAQLAGLPKKPKKGTPEAEQLALLTYYKTVIDDLDAAKAAQMNPSKIWPQFEKPPEAPKKAKATPATVPAPDGSVRINGVKVSRIPDVVFRFTRKEVGPDGILTDTGVAQTTRFGGAFEPTSGRAFQIEAGPVVAKFYPHKPSSPGYGDARGIHGTVRVNVDSNSSTTAVISAFETLEAAGFDVAPPTRAQRELVYLHKTIYLRGDDSLAGYQNILNSADPDEVKIDKVKDWAEKRYSVKIPRDPKEYHRYYNPEGEPPTSAAGRRIYRRWDVDAAEAKKAEEKTAFYHSSSDISVALKAWLFNGGWVTPTSDRLRAGTPMGAGASWDEDYDRGGPGYLYTNRVNKSTAATRSSGFVFKGDLVTRVDIASHTYDSFGAWEANEGSTRRRTLAEIMKPDSFGITTNTGLFKNGIDMASLDYVRIGTNPASLNAEIRAGGITQWPDGRKLEDVIRQ
jgi:16S rRNA G966 N2-methylase RsmD